MSSTTTTLVLLLLPLLVSAGVQAVDIRFVNLCGSSMKLYDGSSVERIADQASVTRSLASASRSYRYGTSNQATLAEFSADADYTWYDIGIVPTGTTTGPGDCTSLADCKAVTGGTGFNVAMQVLPTTDSSGDACRTLTCLEDGCDDAYQYPTDNSKTHNCGADVSFDVFFCPTSENSSTIWLANYEASLSSSDSSSDEGSSSVAQDDSIISVAASAEAPESESKSNATSDSSGQGVASGTFHTTGSSFALCVAIVVGSIAVLGVVARSVWLRRSAFTRMHWSWPERKSSDVFFSVADQDINRAMTTKATAVTAPNGSSFHHLR